MPYVILTVDTETPVSFAPEEERNPRGVPQTRALIQVAKQHNVPLTWFIYTNRTHPEAVIDYYAEHIFPILPETHEIGLHSHFEEMPIPQRDRFTNYQEDPASRRAIMERGYQILLEHGIRPTSHRTGCLCMQECDIPVLEELGILIDSSVAPDTYLGNHPGHGDYRGKELRAPYHPDYHDLTKPGNAKLTIAPIACCGGYNGILEHTGIDAMKQIADYYIARDLPMVMVMHDGISPGEEHISRQSQVLDELIPYLKERNAEFLTMTAFWRRMNHV